MSWWQFVDLFLQLVQAVGVVLAVGALLALIHLEGGSHER